MSGLIDVRRTVASLLAALMLAATVGIVFTTTITRSAGAATPFASGQVFASVGNSTVSVYDPASGNLLNSLVDHTGEPYTAGTTFDSKGDLLVADDTNGEISIFNPDGSLNTQWNNGTFTSGSNTGNGVFAYGLSNPLSLVFDSSGNLYVGQQTTPYIAEFAPNGTRLPDIGPLATQLYGADWIDLSSDQCTFYYTTEGTDVLTYNKCTGTPGTQGVNFNKVPFPSSDSSTNLPVNAFELKILANGDVLVADSHADLLLDSNGNVIQTYPCSSLPSCGGQLFAISVDPNGTSFWTGDSASGQIYEINIVTGALIKTISTHSGTLYGLSVNNQINVATTGTTVAATPTTLAVQPVSGNFSSPTPVSAVLTDSSTGTPIKGEVVTFTLNGTETCQGTTDANGMATCVITPGEPSSSYTLTASFAGDSSQSTPVGSTSSSSNFTVTQDTSSLTYTGPTSGVNGQPITLSGTLTTNTPSPGTPVPTKVVTFTIGSGSSAQSCSGTTDASGNASCIISTVNQPVSNAPITTNFGGDVYDTPVTTTTPATVTEPTTLTVHSATGDFADATVVSGVLTDTLTNAPVAGEPVTLTLNGHETCTATTDATGTASCSLTPGEAAATYPLTGGFGGDSTRPLQLIGASGNSNFVVTLEETALTYTGPATAQNGQPLTLSGVLTTDDPALGTSINGRTVVLTLGTGTTAQSCSGITNASGVAACTITVAGQSPGPIPVSASFASDGYYLVASAASTVNLPEGTQLTVTAANGTYEGSTPLTGTLINTYTNQPVPNEPVTFTVNGGAQSCTALTNAQGVASCPVTPTEPQGSYSLSGSFPGDTTSMPQLNPNSSSSTVTVTQAPTTFVYTGTTSVTNGQSATLSGVLTTSQPSAGTDVSGRTVTLTLGSGTSMQSCTAVTNASGAASCTITSVNQSTGTTGISASYGGDQFYSSSATSSTASVHTPTTLTVNAGTSDFADAGTVSAVLTNSLTGAVIAGESVTLTLNGIQSCTAVTNASGVASCSVTPNEQAATYTVTGSFAGDTTRAPQLLASTGSNHYVVTLEETAITYTGPSLAITGSSFTMAANLTTDGSPLGGRAVLMTLGSGTSAQSCTGTTNAAGNASCTIAAVKQTAGSVPIAVTFTGDAYYRPASAAGTETTAAAPDSGGFVIGDISAGTPPSTLPAYSMSNGNQVNFWGAQLWKTNQYSGVNSAPASMKGYIDNAPSILGYQPGYGCGQTWTSDPGNSSHPPSTIPVNMVVVVSTHINQSGSTESGDIKHVVVVSVAPGYGPAPGHGGYGKIIAWLC